MGLWQLSVWLFFSYGAGRPPKTAGDSFYFYPPRIPETSRKTQRSHSELTATWKEGGVSEGKYLSWTLRIIVHNGSNIPSASCVWFVIGWADESFVRYWRGGAKTGRWGGGRQEVSTLKSRENMQEFFSNERRVSAQHSARR